MSRMLPLSNTIPFLYCTVKCIVSNNTKWRHMLLYFWLGPARLYQFVCYIILVGGHFPQKTTTTFCLAFCINPSFMIHSIWVYIITVCTVNSWSQNSIFHISTMLLFDFFGFLGFQNLSQLAVCTLQCVHIQPRNKEEVSFKVSTVGWLDLCLF